MRHTDRQFYLEKLDTSIPALAAAAARFRAGDAEMITLLYPSRDATAPELAVALSSLDVSVYASWDESGASRLKSAEPVTAPLNVIRGMPPDQ